MNEFNTYHPAVSFVYFASVIAFSMIFMHPVCLAISLVTAFSYSLMLNGKKALKFNLIYILPLMLVSALLNPVFNHEGVTILCYLPSGNPLTIESIAYGIAAAVMIASVICHFSAFNKIMTSDKFMYLFGKVIPSLSLIFSMVLRFVPRFGEQMKAVSNAQRCIGRDASNGGMIVRAKNGIKILSIMITWSLENSIDTADSMKSRGYGTGKRTSFSNFKFDIRDLKLLVWIMFLNIYLIIGSMLDALHFGYFPSMEGTEMNVYALTVFAAYLMLFLSPIIIEMWEVLRWKRLKSKI